MTSLRRIAALIAIAMILVPASTQTSVGGLAGTGLELAGNKLAYRPCGFARRGICRSGQALVSAGGHRRR